MRLSRGLGLAIWGFLAALFTVATLAYAFETAMHFRGVAIDGPFQLYNALRRIQGGFRPGVDFEYFHGLGIPYSHYWLYRLFGGGLRGSELARELITASSYPLVFLAVFRAFTRDWITALCLTATAVAGSYMLKMSPVIFAVNGMLGFRAALPTVLPALLYLIGDARRRSAAAGVTLGVALFMSTEQGLAALLAYIVVSAILLARPAGRRTRAAELASAVAIAMATLVLLVLSVTGFSGLGGALRYNFRAVPADQYWYFGAPPNVFMPSWSAAMTMVLKTPAIAIALVGALACSIIYLRSAWKATDDDAARRAYALALLSVYALISCSSLLGVFTPAYVQPCRRALLIIVLLEWTRYAARVDTRQGRQSWLAVPRSVAISAGIVAIASLATVPLLVVTLTTSAPHVIADHLFGDERFGVGGIWPETLKEAQRAIDAHRGPNGHPPVIWSTYAGWIEARNGLFHPGTDYIIHALGPARAAYADTFRATRPTLVQTVLPEYSQYESWIENNHWAFYDELLRSYRVYSTTPWSIFWERRATPAPPAALVSTISVAAGAGGVRFSVPPSPALADLYEIEIEYAVHNLFAKLPLVGTTPRYLVGIDGAVSHVAVSMDPGATSKRFPLLVRGGSTVTLSFGTFGLLPGASWQPIAVRILKRDVDDGAAVWLNNLIMRSSAIPLSQ